MNYKNLKKNVPILELYFGISLALLVLTNLRIFGKIGFGEILCALSLLVLFFKKEKSSNLSGNFHIVFLYLLFISFPLTVIRFVFGFSGQIPQDILAFFLSFGFVYALIKSNLDFGYFFKVYILALLFIIIVAYAFDFDFAWYGGVRFTGGAKNPNQLALFLVAGLIFLQVTDWRLVFKILISALFIFFGIESKSDAFSVFLITSIFGLAFYPFFRIQPIVTIFISFACLVLLYLYAYGYINEFIIDFMYSADVEAARLVLAKNGILAWLNDPGTLILGNGFGAFSGFDSFQGTEAHNTYIDLLSQIGLIGLICVFWGTPKNIVEALKIKPSLGIIFIAFLVFITFHYSGRQPIFWVLILTLPYLNYYLSRKI